MRVKAGAIEKGRSIDMELDEVDALHHFGEAKWSRWDSSTRSKKLSALCDAMVVQYMWDNSMIGAEYAKSRISALSRVILGD